LSDGNLIVPLVSSANTSSTVWSVQRVHAELAVSRSVEVNRAMLSRLFIRVAVGRSVVSATDAKT
jgi:hypothetical protein